MRLTRITTVILLALALALSLGAQQPAAGGVDHATAIKQTMQQSTAALRHYRWIETTVVSMKGEEKSRTQKSCYYDATGTLQKIAVNAAPPADEKRGVRGRVVENKKEEVSAAVQEAIALISKYVPPDPARIDAAKNAGKLSVVPPDPQGNVRIVIVDYLQAGDSMTIDLNAATNRLGGVSVSTFTAAKDAVGLVVGFSVLPDATVFASKTTTNITSQNMTVVVENSGHEKSGS